MATMNKLRTQMAQQFLDALNQGRIPWKACWQQDRPMNAITGKIYRGVNALNLSYMAYEKGYRDPRWCTYKQAQENGWQVRKGEKSSLVEYWAYFDKKQKKLLPWAEAHRLLKLDPDYIENLQLSSRIYFVFNGEQIDGIPEMEHRSTDIGQLRTRRDTLVNNMAITYQEVPGTGAHYSPRTDTVTLPPENTFDDAYGYMATFLHECAHASGHPSRLNRDLSGLYGSPEYAKEELRAEIASAFAAQAVGLQLTDEQFEYQMKLHSAYLQSWAAALQDAPEELFRAIKAAEEISDYLIEQGDFLQEYHEMVYRLDNDFLYIQTSDSGYDYSFYRPYGQGGYYDLSDGGQLDQPATIEEARDEILKLHDLHPGKIESMDMDEWCELVKPHGFFAKIVYVSEDSELPSYYDDREKYLQELAYQKSHGSPNYGVELTRLGFLKDVSEALLTQGHYMAIGANLTEDYTAEIQSFIAANPPDIEVHPWMSVENLKVAAVHQWEQRQLALMPEELSIVADGHTGQLLVQPGMHQLMNQRYQEHCCPSPEPAQTPLPSYREQIQELADCFDPESGYEP